MPTFRKKPVEVEALQLTAENGAMVARWCGGKWCSAAKASDPTDVAQWIAIPTLEGTMTASVLDWVIRGTEGEFYPCKPAAFAATFEEVD